MFDASTGTFAANKVMRELCKSGAVGYTEPAKTLVVSYEQAQNGEGIVEGEAKYVKISYSFMDLRGITEFTMCADPDAAKEAGIPERIVVSGGFEFEISGDGSTQAIWLDGNRVIWSWNTEGAIQSEGTRVLAQLDENGKVIGWFTDFKFGEDVVHPIDPKYLPEGVGYIETKTEDMYNATGANFVPSDEWYGLPVIPVGTPLVFENGETVVVIWDGVRYESVASVEGVLTTLGNLGLAGFGDDTGEPFIYYGDHVSCVFVAQTEGKHDVSVSRETKNIKKIDSQLLPGATVLNLWDYGLSLGEAAGSGTGSMTVSGRKILDDISTAFQNGSAVYLQDGPFGYPVIAEVTTFAFADDSREKVNMVGASIMVFGVQTDGFEWYHMVIKEDADGNTFFRLMLDLKLT